jgi:hypothetical protein
VITVVVYANVRMGERTPFIFARSKIAEGCREGFATLHKMKKGSKFIAFWIVYPHLFSR